MLKDPCNCFVLFAAVSFVARLQLYNVSYLGRHDLHKILQVIYMDPRKLWL